MTLFFLANMLCCHVLMQVINAYAHIASSDDKNNNKGFITPFEAQLLSRDNDVGLEDHKRRSWIVRIGQKCLDKELVRSQSI